MIARPLRPPRAPFVPAAAAAAPTAEPALPLVVTSAAAAGAAGSDRRTPHAIQESPAPQGSVVGRLKERWKAWGEIGASQMVVEWVQEGVSLSPQSWNTLSNMERKNKVSVTDQIKWTSTEITRLCQSGALTQVNQEDLREVSPIRLAPKKGPKKFRLIVNMRRLNSTLPIRHFKMEGLGTILSLAKPGFHFVTWDLKEGYFHISMSRDTQSLLGISWEGKFYHYNVLPFGCSLSPWVFTKIVKEMVRFWRSMGLLVVFYLDDFCLIAPTRELALLQRDTIIAPTLAKLGFLREESKGSWEPTTRVQVLGLIIDSVKTTVEIPQDKVAAIKTLASQIARADSLPARSLASAAGLVISVARAFSFARLATRSLYQLVDAANREVWEWDSEVPLSEAVREDASWLVETLDRFNGSPAWKPARVVQLFSDASTLGWGAHCRGRRAGGLWLKEKEQFHINTLEMIAVYRALLSFVELLRGKKVQILTDSMTVKSDLTKGGSKDAIRNQMVRLIWAWAVSEDVLFTIDWIPGSSNDLADAESRAVIYDDWSLRRDVFSQLDSLWGPHSVDRFADTSNTQTQRFNSLRACPRAEAVDCFAQDWRGENNWCVPPFHLIHKVLELVEQEGAVATLVVPMWESQPWWPVLVRLAVAWIPLSSTAFVSGPSGYVEPWKSREWHFSAVRICPR